MKVSERIRLAVEEDIRAGVLKPGDAIDEQELAARFGVSRTPVREALIQLKVQGMLESQPRNGMEVARMDVQELLAIWELMAEMEGVCTRMACQRMSDEERQELARIHRDAAALVEADDAEGWREANHAFHEVLYRGCRNPYLRQELLSLRARTGAYLRHAFSAVGRVRASYEQHGELLEAILAHDPERAHRMMMRHISLAQGAKGLADFLINLPRSMVKN
ncbi:GntR family transcriptional regulator [Achromobacter veterisilvae]|uniref:GntR family transcriptional regulator n=1 Tax=Achromobacter veterisilvae TaxID=2069367 RepID=A0A446C8M5_9BURK|nr:MULTISPECIES: GntR family transcriptional regulator [Achromobacter]MCW0209433.1 GntR family transcriptional regulator [Achromobacter sp.]SSW64205.1 putative D-xylose utilization operon transcriptional repressor [Achromobacter veterisilvae]